MNELIKKHAVTGSTLVLAIAMGLQTFVFGSNDMQTLKQQVIELSERIAKLEAPQNHD